MIVRRIGIGSGVFRPAQRSGFTLLEVLLSLAIIALLATVFIGGTAALLSEQPASAEEVFWQAVQTARKTSLQAGRETRLKFDNTKQEFLIVDGRAPAVLGADGFTREETPLHALPVPSAGTSELKVEFLATTRSGPMLLIGGVLVEAQPVPFVTFYGDGTCSPFRVQFARSDHANTLSIDPWTCAQVLTAKESP